MAHDAFKDAYPELEASRRPASALPAIDDTMKQAKIMPWGMCSPSGLRAGVHRKTNVYMLPSNNDCIAPSNPTLGSAVTMAELGFKVSIVQCRMLLATFESRQVLCNAVYVFHIGKGKEETCALLHPHIAPSRLVWGPEA